MAERYRKYALHWLAASLLLALPLAMNNYVQFVVNTMLVYSLATVGFNVVIGYLGQLAFANAAFFGIGAYTAGLLMTHLQLPYPLALAACAAMGGLAGALVGLPALRVRGYYLAIITLAFGELMRWIYVHADGITHGASGFNVPRVSLFGHDLDETGKYYVFLLVVALGLGATRRLMQSRIGRAFVAVRNNEAAGRVRRRGGRARQGLGLRLERPDRRPGGRTVCPAQRQGLARYLRPVADVDAFRHRHDRRAGQPDRLGHRRRSADRRAGAAAQCPRAGGNRVQSLAHGRAVHHAARHRRADRRPRSGRARAPVSGVAPCCMSRT
ncbi:branched-chain amino acid ABC transporter permease [Achromobacter xylosoxidans]